MQYEPRRWYWPPDTRKEWLRRWIIWRLERPRLGDYPTQKQHAAALALWEENRP